LEPTLAFARSLLGDLPGCWNHLEWTQRPGFIRSLYPAGLVFENGAIGTIENSWLFGISGGGLHQEEPLARSSRLALSWTSAL
jgi:hypothetical protein